MRRGAVVLLAIVVATAVVAALVAGGGAEAEGSALSHGAGGWLAARRYLEERGCEVLVLDRPLIESTGRGVLVLAFPWQRTEFGMDETRDALDAHLRRGGTILLAVADQGNVPDPGQQSLLKALALEWRDARGRAPLSPWHWRAFASKRWTLTSAEDDALPALEIAAPRGLPVAPPGARISWRGEGDAPVVFSYARHGGRIVVMPASVWANAWLESAGNADALERSRTSLGDTWTFDEYHHGLVAASPVEDARAGRFLDLFVVHLTVLYVAALIAVARRFGPAWAEPPVISGSTGAFLIGLGGLHHDRGHHGAAARLLVARVQELDPRVSVPAGADDVVDGAGLVALGRDVARAQLLKGGS